MKINKLKITGKDVPGKNRDIEPGVLLRSFDSVEDVVKSLEGVGTSNDDRKTRSIKRCLEGTQVTAYGYYWQYGK